MIEVSRGELSQQPLPVVLSQAHSSRLTGALQLQSGPVRAVIDQVFLRNGYPVAVLLHNGAERLGAVLHETGALDRDRYLRAQSLSPYGDRRIGEVLLRARLLDRTALMEGLRAQVRRRLHALFLIEDASYQVFSGSHDQGLQEGEVLLCDPCRAIYFGIRRSFPETRLQLLLRPLHGQEFRLSADRAREATRWLGPGEARVCELLGRGFFSFKEILDAGGLPAPALQALVYAFFVSSALEVRAAVMARPPRQMRPVARLAELPYQPSDEPLPAHRSPLQAEGRQVLLHGGEGPPPAPASSGPAAHKVRDRQVAIVPIVAQPAAPAASQEPAPTAGQEPPPRPGPSASRTSPGRPAPPLRTSLPSSRLPRKP